MQVRLKPATRTGIYFVRTDRDNVTIPASYHAVKSTFHATLLARDAVEVSTPEHLLAALWGMGVTHCEVEIDGPEVPILDGSAAPWCDVIRDAGITPLENTCRPLWHLTGPVRVEHNGGMVLAVPGEGLRLTVAADFEVDYLPPQLVDLAFPATSFTDAVAPARTFTLEKWIEPLRAQGLIRGGSHDNALVLGETAASSPLRFPEELARHKALDALGDLALLTAAEGALLQAHLILVRAGHGLHYQWIKAAIASGQIEKKSLL